MTESAPLDLAHVWSACCVVSQLKLWMTSCSVIIEIFSCLAIQEAFDQDVKNGCISRDGWNVNATVEGRLGYKLIVQTGEPDNPIDKRRVSKSTTANSRRNSWAQVYMVNCSEHVIVWSLWSATKYSFGVFDCSLLSSNIQKIET